MQKVWILLTILLQKKKENRNLPVSKPSSHGLRQFPQLSIFFEPSGVPAQSRHSCPSPPHSPHTSKSALKSKPVLPRAQTPHLWGKNYKYIVENVTEFNDYEVQCNSTPTSRGPENLGIYMIWSLSYYKVTVIYLSHCKKTVETVSCGSLYHEVVIYEGVIVRVHCIMHKMGLRKLPLRKWCPLQYTYSSLTLVNDKYHKLTYMKVDHNQGLKCLIKGMQLTTNTNLHPVSPN